MTRGRQSTVSPHTPNRTPSPLSLLHCKELNMPVKYDVEKIGEGIKVRLALMSGWVGDLSHPEMVEQFAA